VNLNNDMENYNYYRDIFFKNIMTYNNEKKYDLDNVLKYIVDDNSLIFSNNFNESYIEEIIITYILFEFIKSTNNTYVFLVKSYKIPFIKNIFFKIMSNFSFIKIEKENSSYIKSCLGEIFFFTQSTNLRGIRLKSNDKLFIDFENSKKTSLLVTHLIGGKHYIMADKSNREHRILFNEQFMFKKRIITEIKIEHKKILHNREFRILCFSNNKNQPPEPIKHTINKKLYIY
jgi:hypothetical protein